jgi:two-component system invasion response regulator UvrY
METVLIADDHEIVRNGIRTMIEGISSQYRFIEASTCADVIKVLSQDRIEYAILDMFLADANIFSTIDVISRYSKLTNMLVYSQNAEKIYAKRLLAIGIRGFVSKQASMEELEKAVRDLLRGNTYLSPELRNLLLSPSPGEGTGNPLDSLSDRELEVVEYLAMGLGTKEIAQKMKLDITTVSTYRRRAYEKMKVENFVEMKDKFALYKMSY